MVATDDAYVQADNTLIAPRVSGYISQVLVDDNQPVKAGEVLARIDDRDFQTALRPGGRGPRRRPTARSPIDAQLALQQSLIDRRPRRWPRPRRRCGSPSRISSATAAVAHRRRHRAAGAADPVAAAQRTADLRRRPGGAGTRKAAGGGAASQRGGAGRAATQPAAEQQAG